MLRVATSYWESRVLQKELTALATRAAPDRFSLIACNWKPVLAV